MKVYDVALVQELLLYNSVDCNLLLPTKNTPLKAGNAGLGIKVAPDDEGFYGFTDAGMLLLKETTASVPT